MSASAVVASTSIADTLLHLAAETGRMYVQQRFSKRQHFLQHALSTLMMIVLIGNKV